MAHCVGFEQLTRKTPGTATGTASNNDHRKCVRFCRKSAYQLALKTLSLFHSPHVSSQYYESVAPVSSLTLGRSRYLPEGYSWPSDVATKLRDWKMAWLLILEIGLLTMPGSGKSEIAILQMSITSKLVCLIPVQLSMVQKTHIWASTF